ncbi:MAG: hypothetical protein ACOCRO_09430 [Halanaerobiales bacterium]
MKKIIIEIETVNDAFKDREEHEVTRILENLSYEIRQGMRPEKLKDYNGNTVGSVKYKTTEK